MFLISLEGITLMKINAHLTELLDIIGFLLDPANDIGSIKPTPTPTPADTMTGKLDARYLKPSNIIKSEINNHWIHVPLNNK